MDAVEYRIFAKKHMHLRSSNLLASLIFLAELAFSSLAIWLSLSQNYLVWFLGQILFGISVLHWFVLLHDCGHRYFFKSLWANRVAGHVASLFCIVPFMPWQHIHWRHHVWTGWQDLDPTQQSTVRTNLPASQKAVINFCWKFWVPLFTVSFSFENFWNLPRLYKMFPQKKRKIENTFSVLLIVLFYIVMPITFGLIFLKVWLTGYILFMLISDPLLLSQHAHIPQDKASGEKVTAHKLFEQDLYTRTLKFPSLVSKFVLLNFDAHIVHHLLPNIPCYHLGKIEIQNRNQIDWYEWITTAKKMPANKLLFENSDKSGVRI